MSDNPFSYENVFSMFAGQINVIDASLFPVRIKMFFSTKKVSLDKVFCCEMMLAAYLLRIFYSFYRRLSTGRGYADAISRPIVRSNPGRRPALLHVSLYVFTVDCCLLHKFSYADTICWPNRIAKVRIRWPLFMPTILTDFLLWQ